MTRSAGQAPSRLGSHVVTVVVNVIGRLHSKPGRTRIEPEAVTRPFAGNRQPTSP